MKDFLVKDRGNYVKQLEEVGKAIDRTEANLVALRQQAEQLKGAVFAIDSVLQASAKAEAAAKAEAEARAAAKPRVLEQELVEETELVKE